MLLLGEELVFLSYLIFTPLRICKTLILIKFLSRASLFLYIISYKDKRLRGPYKDNKRFKREI